LENYHYFVAHQFTTSQKADLRFAIESAFEGTGLKAYYADLDVKQGHILDKVKDMIFRMEFGIYDISNPKMPNVFIEYGIAVAAEKPRHLICQKGTNIPVNLEGLGRIDYKNYNHLVESLKSKVVPLEVERMELRKKMEKYTESEVLKKAVKIYQAGSEEMVQQSVVEVADNDASNKKAWYGDSSFPNRVDLIYGPYESLPFPGRYSAFFKLKIDKNSDINEAVHIDVYSNKNPGVNSSKLIRGIHFEHPEVYQIFAIDFIYMEGTDMEYRVTKLLQERHIWIDYIAVVEQDSI